MANGKITLEEFKKLDQATRDFHIWSKLQALDGLSEKFSGKWVENTLVWSMRVVGGLILVALIGLVIIKK